MAPVDSDALLELTAPSLAVTFDKEIVALETTQVVQTAAQTATSSTKTKKPTQRRRTQAKGKATAINVDNTQQKKTIKKTEIKKQTKRVAKKPPPPTITQEPEDDDDFSEELADTDELYSLNPQRHLVLERNRVAATKCRRRKRSEASMLASSEQEIEETHRYLSATASALRNEAYLLKTKLLEHTDCNCVLIQRYIAHEAKRSVDRMTGVEPAPVSGQKRFREGMSTSTPEGPGSSSASTVAESSHAQSPMTSITGEGVTTPWQEGYGDGNSAIPAQLLEGYQGGAAMMPFSHMAPGTPMTGFPTRPMVDVNEADYLQQGFTNNMMWDPGWQIG
ncbi:bZIP transcription factor [Tolypothrix sp. FACHB-123]|nr:bZIP transcription factor [Tolypothrix sp. FACHB-123]